MTGSVVCDERNTCKGDISCKRSVESCNEPPSKKGRLDKTVDDKTEEGDRVIEEALRGNISPNEYLKVITSSLGLNFKSSISMPSSFFLEITPDSISSYTNEVVRAINDSDIKTLKQHNLQCCNRFGESGLHLACRRGLLSVVNFMISDNVCVRRRDDSGRTPLHDACWNAIPNFQIMELLINKDPALLFLADKRGFTPLQYARKEHWSLWRQFLFDNRHSFEIHHLDLIQYLT